jgi:hypothetical protein
MNLNPGLRKKMFMTDDQLDRILTIGLLFSGSFFLRFAFPGFDGYNDVNATCRPLWLG